MSKNWNPEAELPACADDELCEFTMTSLETGKPLVLKYRPLKVLVYDPYNLLNDMIEGIGTFGPLMENEE